MNRQPQTPGIDEQTKTGLHQLAEMQEKLVLKAWSDPEFKKELLADPAKAVEKALGIRVPAFLKLRVIEETADIRYITIPYRANASDRQLGDEELEKVAGGVSCTDPQECNGRNC